MIPPKDLGGLLFSVHSHAGDLPPDEIVYKESDVVQLLKQFGFPDPEFGESISIADYDFEARAYVGIPLVYAQMLAQANGVRCRVVEKDGQHMAITHDFDNDRLNFSVENGEITKVTRG